jgi:hypothetical protein
MRGAVQSLDMELDMKHFDVPGLLAKFHWANAFGVGIAQAPRDGALAGRIYIVVLAGHAANGQM